MTNAQVDMNATRQAWLSQTSRINSLTDSMRTLQLQLSDIGADDPRHPKLQAQLAIFTVNLEKAHEVLVEIKTSLAFAETNLQKAQQRLEERIQSRAFPSIAFELTLVAPTYLYLVCFVVAPALQTLL